jgi:hypothetical protein
MNVPKNDLSVLTLIAVNLAPLIGVLWFGWDAAVIVLLYWAENLVIGFYNVLRMALVRVDHPIMNLQKVLAIPFFCLHFGGFCAIHGVFLLAFFNYKEGLDSALSGHGWPGPLVFFWLLHSVVSVLWQNHPDGMGWLVLGLACSHGISFVQNFVIGKEYTSLTTGVLMGRPYTRIVILHVAIIAGGIPIMMIGSPAPLVVILVLIKIGMDLWLHRRSHRVSPPRPKVVRMGTARADASP